MAMLTLVRSLQAETCLSPAMLVSKTCHCSKMARPCSCASASVEGQKAAASLFQAVFSSKEHMQGSVSAVVSPCVLEQGVQGSPDIAFLSAWTHRPGSFSMCQLSSSFCLLSSSCRQYQLILSTDLSLR